MISSFVGTVVSFDNDLKEGVVELPTEYRSFKFSLRCYYPLFPDKSYPVSGDSVEVICSPAIDKLLSVRAHKR